MGPSCTLGTSYVGPARKSSPFGHIHSNKSFNDLKLVHSKWLYVGFIFVFEMKSKSIGRYKSRTGSTQTACPGRINSDRLGSNKKIKIK